MDVTKEDNINMGGGAEGVITCNLYMKLFNY